MAEEKIVLNLYWSNMLSRPTSRVAEACRADKASFVADRAATIALGSIYTDEWQENTKIAP